MQTQIHSAEHHAAVQHLDNDTLLNSAQTKTRCGNVTDMCIWRWMRDPRVQFPLPVTINRRNYWRLGDLRHWQEQHAAKRAA